jgi:hypothetical protein
MNKRMAVIFSSKWQTIFQAMIPANQGVFTIPKLYE